MDNFDKHLLFSKVQKLIFGKIKSSSCVIFTMMFFAFAWTKAATETYYRNNLLDGGGGVGGAYVKNAYVFEA